MQRQSLVNFVRISAMLPFPGRSFFFFAMMRMGQTYFLGDLKSGLALKSLPAMLLCGGKLSDFDLSCVISIWVA